MVFAAKSFDCGIIDNNNIFLGVAILGCVLSSFPPGRPPPHDPHRPNPHIRTTADASSGLPPPTLRYTRQHRDNTY